MISKLNLAYAQKLSRTRRRGATMMEVIAVLFFIGLLAAGALVLWSMANTSSQTTTALTQLNSIQSAVRTLYNGQPNYTGLNTGVIVNSQALPTSMISGNAIRHAFNGNVTVAPATSTGGGANSAFTVSFSNIPSNACQQLLTKDLGRGLYSAGASTQQQQPSLPFTLAAATTSCNASYNTVSWTFF